MNFNLPQPYLAQMRLLLGDDFASFLHSYAQPRTYGLRLHTPKLQDLAGTSPEQAARLLEKLQQTFRLVPVPWCPNGHYFDESTRPGKHPWHAAGLYYIQEPSAMAVAAELAPLPGETVLDLAAAPGGKTTHLAALMQQQGLLVANEIHPVRAGVLSENVERLGLTNTVVVNAEPPALAARFPGFFDRILLDAPCSGEGMFRKDPAAITEWSPGHVDFCATRAAAILLDAARMLKPGGRLVYSTCTFNSAENEDTLAAFLQKQPAFRLDRSLRLWPHLVQGEGHFIAVLTKTEELSEAETITEEPGGKMPLQHGRTRASGRAVTSRRHRTESHAATYSRAALSLFHTFADACLPDFALPPGEPLLYGDTLYWLPRGRTAFSAASLEGLRAPRPGLQLGSVRKERFTPAHALAKALRADQAIWTQSYAAEDDEIAAYLHGDTLSATAAARSWGLIAVDGLPLGWGKASAGIVKNHYPKGLRLP